MCLKKKKLKSTNFGQINWFFFQDAGYSIQDDGCVVVVCYFHNTDRIVH